MRDNNAIPSGERPAVPAPADLHAEYKTDTGTSATLRIYAFSTEGHPLVLAPGGNRLVRPEVAERKMSYTGVHTPYGPALTGPFTPAPPGLVAVFKDGHEQPVLYYDVHGRAVLMDMDDITCDLFLAESTNDVVRVEYRPSVTDDRSDVFDRGGEAS
jgi:hypothetical protein